MEKKENSKLNDKELDQVSGGNDNDNAFYRYVMTDEENNTDIKGANASPNNGESGKH